MKVMYACAYAALAVIILGLSVLVVVLYTDKVYREARFEADALISKRERALQVSINQFRSAMIEEYKPERVACKITQNSGMYVSVMCRNDWMASSDVYIFKSGDIQGLKDSSRARGLWLNCKLAYQRQSKKFSIKSCAVARGVDA